MTRKKEIAMEEPPLIVDDPGFQAEIDANEQGEAWSPDVQSDIDAIPDGYLDFKRNELAEITQVMAALTKPTRDKFVTTNGGLYLPVRQRIVWMRGEPVPHPDWLIQTELIHYSPGDYQGTKHVMLGMNFQEVPDVKEGYAIVQARVITRKEDGSEGCIIGEGTAMERSEVFHDFIEKAETSAIGRALAVAGYGTEAAIDLDEGAAQGNIADAPVRRPGGPMVSWPNGPSAPAMPPGDITIEPSAIPGIRQGGRQSKATTAQIAAIRERASEKMMSPVQLQEIIRKVIPPPNQKEDVPDFYTDDVDNTPDGINLVLGFLAGLSFEECGAVVLAVSQP